jgi:Uma2 family endonuclease
MTSTLTLSLEQLYPSGDGQPMAENTEQYQWLVLIKENLEIIFAADPQVFIAGDLFWYPVTVAVQNPPPRYAPDVMVVFGRPKGKRKSYRQWQEEDVAPQVVFEILSDSNKTARGREEMAQKLNFYDRYGVEEYYTYDPDDRHLQIWQAVDRGLVLITNPCPWTSPRLQVQFIWQPGQELRLLRPDGQPFLNSIELQNLLNQERERVWQEQQRVRQERERTEQERERGDRAEAQLQQVAQNLLATGMEPTEVARLTGLTLGQVQDESP